ncbi:MAG: hypothetical protein BM559_03745 [Roseobacter sp. MedPE-SWchi]|nr:MAG: hypothetical protein BM559_03745 [Roseobacter sp. MedPE-SWchi]
MITSVLLLVFGMTLFVGGALLVRQNKLRQHQKRGGSTEANAQNSTMSLNVISDSILQFSAIAVVGSGGMITVWAIGQLVWSFLT